MEGIGIIRIFVTAKVNMKRIFRKKMTEEVVCEYRLFFFYNHRILDGCFLVARAQEIFCGNLFLDVASQEILEEILFKNGLWPEIIIFK